MDVFRRMTNPWGEEILVGIAWDLIWLATAAGLLFVIGHAVYVRFFTTKDAGPTDEEVARFADRVPEQVVRHSLAARLSHGILAAAVLVLLATAFVPILGLKFGWLTIHWIAGLVLAAYVVYHTIHSIARGNLRSMWIGRADLEEARLRLAGLLRRAGLAAGKPGKWGLENRLFHLLAAVLGVAVVATGILMMLRIRTPFWEPNPYILGDGAWGIVFVIHGASAVAFIATITAHIYFALRPEKRFLTASMIAGRIDRRRFVWHYDPERWPVAGDATGQADAPVAPSPPPVPAESQ